MDYESIALISQHYLYAKLTAYLLKCLKSPVSEKCNGHSFVGRDYTSKQSINKLLFLFSLSDKTTNVCDIHVHNSTEMKIGRGSVKDERKQ